MDYDAIVIGGGLAGATISNVLAAAGKRVLVLERTTEFKDRVRGEILLPWGVAEARELGVHDLLRSTCGREIPYIDARIADTPPAPPRDLVETTPHHAGILTFQHAEMQRVLLGAAEKAGAEVRRGVAVAELSPGCPPAVAVHDARRDAGQVRARIVIAAVGRRSAIRQRAGFAVRNDPDRNVIAGVMLEAMRAPDDTVRLHQNLETGQLSVIAPLGDHRHRAYFCHHKRGRGPAAALSGEGSMPVFAAASAGAGVPPDWFEGSRVVGPLASFDCADSWVEHPYHDGVALLGDAAAASDPAFGCGLALTLRGVRVLRDQLLKTDDWDTAGHAYAAEQNGHAASLRRITNWLTDLWFEPGLDADRLRARALPRLAEDPTRLPDFVGLGADSPSDEPARRRLFGED